jgi:fumarylacetoacetate (FAA) hydrolase family protein
MQLVAHEVLPADADQAILVGRVWSEAAGGPCPALVRHGRLLDLTVLSATVSGLMEVDGLADWLAQADGLPDLGSVDDALAGRGLTLLAPIDLQAVKAAGVTFADSMVERVIEEQAKGDSGRAQDIRDRLAPVIGQSLRGVPAGSEKAQEVKRVLQDLGLWSQYLEVGIGPDAEIFTKAQPMASVGCGADVGIRWNDSGCNPGQRREPSRCRGAVSASAWQGQGQQRFLRCGAVPAALPCRV